MMVQRFEKNGLTPNIGIIMPAQLIAMQVF